MVLGRTRHLIQIAEAMGTLVPHITGGAEATTFQPKNVNFGLFPPYDVQGGLGCAAEPVGTDCGLK